MPFFGSGARLCMCAVVCDKLVWTVLCAVG